MAVKGFFGEFRFLSNFWPSDIRRDGITYPTVEHAYQASKTLDPDKRQEIANAPSAGAAKRLGTLLVNKHPELIRPDWDQIKVQVMRGLLREKFNQPGLKEALLSTEAEYLEETNSWGDGFWGVHAKTGKGRNQLGLLLMEIRAELAPTCR